MCKQARGFVEVVNSSVVGINEDDCFVFVQQRIPLGDVIRAGRCDDYGVSQSGLGIPLVVDLHAKALLVALLDPMHFGMALMMAYRWYLSHFFQANSETVGW